MIGVQDDADDNDTDGPCVRFAFLYPMSTEKLCAFMQK